MHVHQVWCELVEHISFVSFQSEDQVAHRPRKNALDSAGNPDHVTLAVGLGLMLGLGLGLRPLRDMVDVPRHTRQDCVMVS